MTRFVRSICAAVALLASAASAFGQSSILQGGPWVPGHAPMYVGQGMSQPIVQDSGAAGSPTAGMGLSELLMVARGTGTGPYPGQGTGPLGTINCEYDGPAPNNHYLCFSPNAQGGALIATGASGTATAQPLCFNVNGAPFCLGGGSGTAIATYTAPTVVGVFPCWSTTSGNLAGCSNGAATLVGNPSASPGNPVAFTIPSLPARGAPDANNDKIPIQNNSTGAINYVTPGQIAVSATAGVSSLGGVTGAITLGSNMQIVGQQLNAVVGGSSGQILYNNAGVFGGFTAGGDCTVVPSTGVFTCLKVNGVNFGTFATANAATPPAIGGTTPAAGSFSSLTDTGITGSTQCVQANSSGTFAGAGAGCVSLSGNNAWTGNNYFGGIPLFDVLSAAHGCAAADPTGTTDSTASIQCHIDYLNSTYAGGIVWLSPGNYLAASTIHVSGGVWIKGASIDSAAIHTNTDTNVLSFYITGGTCPSGGMNAGLDNISVYGYQNAGAGQPTVKVGANCLVNFYSSRLWFGAQGLNTAGTDGLCFNTTIAGYTENVFSSGSNWYVRCKLDSISTGIPSFSSFVQGANAAGLAVAENYFEETDLSVAGSGATWSLFYDDVNGNGYLKFVNSIFDSPVLINHVAKAMMVSATFGSTVAHNSGSMSVVGSTSISGSLTITGAGGRSCAGNLGITC